MAGLDFQAEVGTIAALVSAIAMLVLAGLLLVLRFSNRLHQALALMLVVKAFYVGLLGFGEIYDDLAGRLQFYALIGLPFATAGFALAYSARHGRSSGSFRRWAPWLLLAGAVVCEVAFLLDHGIFRTRTEHGPFTLFFALPTVVSSLLVVQMVRDFRAAPPGRRRRSFLLAAIAFGIEPMASSVFHALGPLGDALLAPAHTLEHTASPYLFWGDQARVAALCILFAAGILFAWRTRRPDRMPPSRGESLALFGAWGAAAVIGVVDAAFFRNLDGVLQDDVHRTISAVVVVSSTGLLTYAMLKHQLFDVELRLRWAIKQSTVASAFVVTFLIVSQLIQNASTDTLGVVVGAVATGLLLFALSPLQRMAERVAYGAVPHKPIEGMAAGERQAIYREQLEIAWSDGVLTPKERVLFATLQHRLGLSAEEAQRLEADVIDALPRVTKPRGRRTTA